MREWTAADGEKYQIGDTSQSPRSHQEISKEGKEGKDPGKSLKSTESVKTWL